MATKEHKTSRRTVLAGLAGAPVAFMAAGPISAAETVDSAAWDQALAIYEAADAAFDVAFSRYYDADEVLSFDTQDQQTRDRLWSEAEVYRPAFSEARNYLMSLPAPTKDALIVKARIAMESLETAHTESALNDIARLTGQSRRG